MRRTEFSGFRTSVRSALAKLKGGQLTPLRFASSVAVGTFVGTLPLYGGHLVLCMLLSVVFRLNLFVAYAAAHISIPPLIPLLLYASYRLGGLIISSPEVPDLLHPASFADLGVTVLAGSVLLGLVLGMVFGAVALGLALALARTREDAEARARRRTWARVRKAVHARYADATRSHSHYVSLKLLLDPLGRQLLDFAPRIPDGAVLVDAGCGRGQFAFLLATVTRLQRIVGFDLDPEKIRCAEQAAASGPGLPRVDFFAQDLSQAKIPECDVCLLLDVLHYLSSGQQQVVLERVADALRPGGILLVRETGTGGRARLAQTFERLGRAWGINRGHTLEFREPGGLRLALEALGLQQTGSREAGPLDNILLTFRKAKAVQPTNAPLTPRSGPSASTCSSALV